MANPSINDATGDGHRATVTVAPGPPGASPPGLSAGTIGAFRGWKEPLALAALVVFCLAPFLGKAFHIDDPLFIWAARQIEARPLDFYGVEVNWYGNPRPLHAIMKNPPLAAFYIAAAARVVGWSEPGLHAAFLLPAIAAILGTFALATRFTRLPWLAAGVALSSPVFLLSSSSVMCDTPMLSLWVWAVFLWITGLERKIPLRLAAAAVLVAAAALTKYFGAGLIPLLGLYALLRERRVGAWTAVLVFPALTLAGYQLLTNSLYGTGLVADAAAYALDHQRIPGGWPAKAAVLLCFCGGCLLPVSFLAVRLWPARVLAAAAMAVAALAAALVFGVPEGMAGLRGPMQNEWAFAAQFALLGAGGVGVLALAATDLVERRDPDALLLALWVVGTVVFAGCLNWSISGRSLLPLAPVAGILAARRIEARRKAAPQGGAPGFWAWPLLPAAAAGLLVACSDHALAAAGREAAERLTAVRPAAPHHMWFQGHWGFQYYMEQQGALPLTYERLELDPGDVVVIPRNNTNLKVLPNEATRAREALVLPVSRALTPMRQALGAGFYSDRWGPLPFSVGRVPPERYDVLDIVRPIRTRPPD